MTNTQYFLLRRLHSLLGVFPLGIFLINHLITNSTGMISARSFEEKVYLIHLLGPLLPIVEAVMIFIPLALHIVLGIYIATQARYEQRGSMATYPRNWMYNFQRWTGWIALIFIVYHVLHLRFLHAPIDVKPFSVTLAEMFYNMPYAALIVPAYILGGLAVVFHFANGLCTFCMSWGITSSEKSQRFVTIGASGVGVVLTLLLLVSVAGFAREGAKMAAMDDVDREAYVAELASIHAKN